jgi:hypothetical protein
MMEYGRFLSRVTTESSMNNSQLVQENEYPLRDLTLRGGLSVLVFRLSDTQSVVFARKGQANVSLGSKYNKWMGSAEQVNTQVSLAEAAEIYLCEAESEGARYTQIKRLGEGKSLLDDAPGQIQDQLNGRRNHGLHLTEIEVFPQVPTNINNINAHIVPVNLASGEEGSLRFSVYSERSIDTVIIESVNPNIPANEKGHKIPLIRVPRHDRGTGRRGDRGFWQFPPVEDYPSIVVPA